MKNEKYDEAEMYSILYEIINSRSHTVFKEGLVDLLEFLEYLEPAEQLNTLNQLYETLHLFMLDMYNKETAAFTVVTGLDAYLAILYYCMRTDYEEENAYREIKELIYSIMYYSEKEPDKALEKKLKSYYKKTLGDINRKYDYFFNVHGYKKSLFIVLTEKNPVVNGLCITFRNESLYDRQFILYETHRKEDSIKARCKTLFHELGHDLLICTCREKERQVGVFEELLDLTVASPVSYDEKIEICAKFIGIALALGTRYEEHLLEIAGNSRTEDLATLSYNVSEWIKSLGEEKREKYIGVSKNVMKYIYKLEDKIRITPLDKNYMLRAAYDEVSEYLDWEILYTLYGKKLDLSLYDNYTVVAVKEKDINEKCFSYARNWTETRLEKTNSEFGFGYRSYYYGYDLVEKEDAESVKKAYSEKNGSWWSCRNNCNDFNPPITKGGVMTLKYLMTEKDPVKRSAIWMYAFLHDNAQIRGYDRKLFEEIKMCAQMYIEDEYTWHNRMSRLTGMFLGSYLWEDDDKLMTIEEIFDLAGTILENTKDSYEVIKYVTLDENGEVLIPEIIR